MGWQAVINFWFYEISPTQWWQKDDAFDRSIRERFGALLQRAKLGELFEWRTEPQGRLAEILVLDQFSRNAYRGSPAAFEADGMALVLAQEAVAQGVDRQLLAPMRPFLYMPYMHSESALIHQQALTLFAREGAEGNLAFEQRHKAIIDRFGRYPHRNQILGRPSTAEELAFLQTPGSGF